jgi:heat shock protein HtpX
MSRNTAKSFILLAGLGGFFVLLGRVFAGPAGMTIGLVMGLLMVGFSFWFSAKLAIRSAHAVEVTEQQYPQYYQIMRELSQRAEIPMPKLYVAPNPQPNAFATGRGPKNAAVCINEGIINALSWDELAGVLAHELAHVKNRDVLIGSIAAAIGTAISFIANMAMFFGGGGDDEDRPNPIAAIAMMMLAPMAASIIQMAVSRSREYEADRAAARMMGDGEPLARALEKISFGVNRRPVMVNPNQASHYIANPLGGLRMAGMGKLFTTHPPMEERIARLRSGEWRQAF